ncbi:MAG TPA: response regulator transcription factor [Vicinamibacterales bacterium]|nr:response regulator transcription factor [Vicinamibacterales bacterium]
MISETPTSPDSFDEPIRIVLVGNERVTRAGLRLLIDGQPGLLVVAEEECTGDLVALMATTEPQIAIIDVDGARSVDFIPNVREAGLSGTRIIVLTSTPESAACASAVQRGVLGIVSKQQAPEILIKAIERVHAGEVWLNRARIAGVLGSLRASASATVAQRRIGRPENLLPRERQIIALVGQGFRNNEIASTIFVSEATVRNCLGSIFKKLGVSNRVHLMIFAIQEGLVTLPDSGTAPVPASPRDVLRLAASGTVGRRTRVTCDTK